MVTTETTEAPDVAAQAFTIVLVEREPTGPAVCPITGESIDPLPVDYWAVSPAGEWFPVHERAVERTAPRLWAVGQTIRGQLNWERQQQREAEQIAAAGPEHGHAVYECYRCKHQLVTPLHFTKIWCRACQDAGREPNKMELKSRVWNPSTRENRGREGGRRWEYLTPDDYAERVTAEIEAKAVAEEEARAEARRINGYRR